MAFSFGGGAPTATAPPNELEIPPLLKIFPHLELAEEIEQSGITGGRIQTMESRILDALIHTPTAATAPDHNLRNQLLHIDLKINGQAAKLNQSMLTDVVQIADALQVPEATAIGLYQSAGCSYHSGSVRDAAIRLYWDCRMRQVRIAKTILLLGLHEQDCLSAVDFLLSENLLQHISRGLQIRRLRHHEEYPFTKEIHKERDALAETAFFASYHLQQKPNTPNWVNSVLESERAPTLDPFRDVTRPDAENWEETLIEAAFSTGLPQYLRTYSILVAASACHPEASIDLSELRFKVIPAICTIRDAVESKVVARDFLLTTLATYLARTHHHHTDWFATANLLCSIGFSGCFEHEPSMARDSDDPHYLLFAYFTHQTLPPEASNRILQSYKNQLDGTFINSTRSTFGNEYYSLYTSYAANETVNVTQKSLSDAARASVISHAFHANDLKLLLEFALGTPIDRKVRGVLFEASARIIQDSISADLALRILTEFHAVPSVKMDNPTAQQHFMFFLPSDVEKASHQERVRYDASFGMLFSIHISERQTGCEATLGFLELLSKLANYIPLPALYIEYVFFVLEHMNPKTERDCNRIYVAAMGFLQSVLVRFGCFSNNFGYEDLNRHLVVAPPKSDRNRLDDFKLTGQDKINRDDANFEGPSGGFAVLVSMLCRNRCILLQEVLKVLMRNKNKALSSFVKLTLTRALYGDTAPSQTTARLGDRVSTQQRKTYGEKEKNNIIFLSADDFEMKAVQAALSLLCATLLREEEFHRKIKATGQVLRYVPTLKTLPIKPVEDGALHLAENLVTLFGEASPWRFLIEYIGVQTGDPSAEAFISGLATAALWGLLNKLPLPQASQVLHTQIDNGHGGTKLAKSLTLRLKSYQSRALETEDWCYLRFLAHCILEDLRSGHRVVAASLFGSSSQVLETLIFLSGSDEFLCNDNSADVASKLFEIIYVLIRLGDQDAIIASRTTLLRQSDFWNLTIRRLLDQDFAVDHVNSVSWLLKAFAQDLSLAGGALRGCSASTADQHVLGPTPEFFKRYISDLLLDDDCYFMKALQWLCFEETVQVPSSFLFSQKMKSTLAQATEDFVGADGLCTGSIINIKLLQEKIGDDPELVDLKAWSLSFNQFTRVEGAKAHLADALWNVLGAVVLTSQYTSTSNHLAVSGCATILPALLKLLVQGNIRHQPARTLAKMVFNVSGVLFQAGVDDDYARVSAHQIIQAMGAGYEDSNADTYEREKVSLLGSSLVLMSKRIQGSSFSLNEDFPKAFRALLHVSLGDSGASSATRKILCDVIAFAKSGLDTIILRNLIQEQFTNDTVEAFADVSHDEATLLLYSELCSFPGMASFLINRGVLVGLKDAAFEYRRDAEKNRFEEGFGLKFVPTAIQVPSNLYSVLGCLCTFVRSTDPEDEATQHSQICTVACEILCCYEPVFRHAVVDFPRNGSANLILAFTRCLFQIQQTSAHIANKEIVEFMKGIADISLRISYNLLPWELPTNSGGNSWWADLNDENLTRQPMSKAACDTAIQAAELAACGISFLSHFIDISNLSHDQTLWDTMKRSYTALESVHFMLGASTGIQGFDDALADQSDLRILYGKCYDITSFLLMTTLARQKSSSHGISTEERRLIIDQLSFSVEKMVWTTFPLHLDILFNNFSQDNVVDGPQKRKLGILKSLVEAIKKELPLESYSGA